MGEQIWVAKDLVLERHVAIKFVHDSFLRDNPKALTIPVVGQLIVAYHEGWLPFKASPRRSKQQELIPKFINSDKANDFV